jgi:AraC-like DNA-binding protein
MLIFSEKLGQIPIQTGEEITEISDSYNPGKTIRVKFREVGLSSVYIIQVRVTEDDRLIFKSLQNPISLIFLFGGSAILFRTARQRKIIHDRGAQLFQLADDRFYLSLFKEHMYHIVLISLSEKLMPDDSELNTKDHEYRSPRIPAGFINQRSRVADRTAIDLLSILFFPPGSPADEIMTGEIIHVLLQWFFEIENAIFQPGNLTIREASEFYEEKNRLLKVVTQTLVFRKLVEQAGIQQLSLFRKRLKQLYDLNIQQFVTEARMALAITLIRENELSIKQIAAKTGFANIQYFSHVFSEYFGSSPKSFRE